ncbi:MAG TPA: ribonuclease H-like domain-containing protein [Clostridiales bacterium]|nr:ribonuclease H-like domain-containing protein [Clostridiales bacterium]
MYHAIEQHQEVFYNSKILDFYFENLNIGVIDIETTGINPLRNRFILGGLLVPDSAGKCTMQFFAESKEEETALLHTYLSHLRDLDVLISYNGDQFDIPFLMKRLQNYNTNTDDLLFCYSFDIYQILHRFSMLRKVLPNLQQKTVEAFLGLWSKRTDEISGAESVELYYRFLGTGDSTVRDIILLHNKDDILQLSRLIKILGKLDLHEIMFHMGFPVAFKEMRAFIKKITMKNNVLSISGIHKNISTGYRCYQPTHDAVFSVKSREFTLSIPWMNIRGLRCLDLESFQFDCSDLGKYPNYHSGYMLLENNFQLNYAEINHFIKLIIKEIMKEL